MLRRLPSDVPGLKRCAVALLLLSGCNPIVDWLPTADTPATRLSCVTLCSQFVIPDWFSEPFVQGDQDDLDAGHVVEVTDALETCAVFGFTGRHFAGHYSSHGGVFALLPDNLGIGDRVIVYDTGLATDYVVAGLTHFTTNSCADIWGDAVVQTSHPDGGAYIWHLTTTEEP